MSNRVIPAVLVVAVLLAVGVAFVRPGKEAVAEARAPEPQPLPAPMTNEPAFGPSTVHGGGALPPNHPPIGASGTGAPMQAEDEAPAITWKVPAAWVSAPNTSPMRLATYRVPASRPATEPGDFSIVRAGGTTDANIERWLGQFDDAGHETRRRKVVRGLTVTIVEVTGTFTGGAMMPGAAPSPRAGWALLGAIVESRGSSTFFKLTGDKATIHDAEPAFETLIDSITPS